MDSPMLLAIPGLGYCAASGLSLLRLERATQRPAWLRAVLIYVSVALHTALLGVRVAHTPASPLSGVRESVVLVSLLMVVAYLMTARYLRGEGIAAVVLLVGGAAVVIAALTLPHTPAPVREELRTPWLWLHVPLCLLAFLAYALAGSGAVMYLAVSGLLKSRRAMAIWPNMPTLDSLDRFSQRMAELGFPLLTAGLISGMLWAANIWGTPFQMSPKLMVAAITWFVYVVYFHVRTVKRMRGRRCAWLLVIGALTGILGYIVAAIGRGPHNFT